MIGIYLFIHKNKIGLSELSKRRNISLDIDIILIQKYGLRPSLITNLGNIYKVLTVDGTYAFKIYDWPVHFNFHFALQQQLNKNGFSQYPRVISTLDGLNSVEIGGMTYILSEWVEGIKPSFSNVEHLKIGAAFLAFFHRAATSSEEVRIKSAPNDFLYPNTFNDMRVGQFRNGVIIKKLKEWVQQFGTDPLKIALERLEHAEYMFPLDSYEELVTLEREENTFIHGDYNASNLILSPEGKVYLIDFDDSSYFVRISDLIFFCHLHMGKEAEFLLEILKSYHKVRPLSNVEFEIIKSQLFVPGKIYWEMHVNTFLNNPISKEWINKSLGSYSRKEFFDKIKKLSYSDLY